MNNPHEGNGFSVNMDQPVMNLDATVKVLVPKSPLGVLAYVCWRMATWFGATASVEVNHVDVRPLSEMPQENRDAIIAEALSRLSMRRED